jgi:hypothetical protein
MDDKLPGMEKPGRIDRKGDNKGRYCQNGGNE